LPPFAGFFNGVTVLPNAYGWAVHAGEVLSGTALVMTVPFAARAWKKNGNPIDAAYMVGALGWLAYLIASNSGIMALHSSWTVFFAYAGYQLTLVWIAFFLLVTASITHLRIHALWITQGVAGLLLLYAWKVLESEQSDLAYRLWVGLNLGFTSVLTLYFGLNVYRMRTYRCWLVFGGSLLGLGLCYQDMLVASRLYPGISLPQYFYATFLLIIWLLLTNRAGRSEAANETDVNQSHSTWESVTGFFSEIDYSAVAVTNERRRIAQDLHDGVASQLVNVLAALDTRSAEQQAVALALEQCLLDLKIMVDSIESAEGSVIDALGRLRYRVQHALDNLGIRMIWTVDVDGPLQHFCGKRGQHVLRITQECLSNIMRHAHASVIEVSCRYQAETDSLLLEVHDNGCGMPNQEAARPAGMGLKGLRLRADLLGAKLKIVTKAQEGTCIRLLVPMRDRKIKNAAH